MTPIQYNGDLCEERHRKIDDNTTRLFDKIDDLRDEVGKKFNLLAGVVIAVSLISGIAQAVMGG